MPVSNLGAAALAFLTFGTGAAARAEAEKKASVGFMVAAAR